MTPPVSVAVTITVKVPAILLKLKLAVTLDGLSVDITAVAARCFITSADICSPVSGAFPGTITVTDTLVVSYATLFIRKQIISLKLLSVDDTVVTPCLHIQSTQISCSVCWA